MENLTYDEFINNILETRGRFACGDEYHERHHIVPKCVGGTNDEENLVDLFAREHFIAHKMLAEENPNEEGLLYAWWCMSIQTNEHTKERYQLTAEEYEEVRTKFALLMSDKMSGDGNRMWNRPWWDEDTPQDKIDEWKNNIVEATKRRWQDPEFKEKMCKQRKGMNCGEANPMYGKIVSEETRQKISQTSRERWADPEYRKKCIEHLTGENNPFYGKHHTEESKRKMSESKKGLQIGEKNPRYGKGHKVVQLTMYNEWIAEFNTIIEASKSTNINKGNISNACRGWYQSAGGYRWMYKEDWEAIQGAENIDRKN